MWITFSLSQREHGHTLDCQGNFDHFWCLSCPVNLCSALSIVQRSHISNPITCSSPTHQSFKYQCLTSSALVLRDSLLQSFYRACTVLRLHRYLTCNKPIYRAKVPAAYGLQFVVYVQVSHMPMSSRFLDLTESLGDRISSTHEKRRISAFFMIPQQGDAGSYRPLRWRSSMMS